MGSGPGSQPPLKVDPEQLAKLGGQLLSAAGDLPEAPAPFTVTGTDAISQAIADKLPGLEGPIQEALPQLKAEASGTASNVVTAAGKYASTDAQLAADYAKHQFDSAGASGSSGGAGSGGGDAMSQMGQMMSMPLQMASQAAQLPMQAMGAVSSVPQGIMQGVQQIGQMTGGLGGSDKAAEGRDGSPDATQDAPADSSRDDHRRDEDKGKHEAAPGPGSGERAPDPSIPAVPQHGSPRHAAPDPKVNL
jgi:hypothetical protein